MADLHPSKDLVHPSQDSLNHNQTDVASGSAALDESERDRRSMVDANEPPPLAEAARDLQERDRREFQNNRAPENDRPVTLRQGNDTAPSGDAVSSNVPQLFSDFDIDDLRSRWSNVQAGFVDSPRRSVQQADELVAAVMQRLANGFAEERSSLEKQWDRGDNVSTEELRVALQRYRSFFARLLNVA
jgi:hypothetical protein